MDANAGAVIIGFYLLLLVVLFLVFRQFVLWYFRINERTDLLRDIRNSLRQLNASQSSYTSERTSSGAPTGEIRRRPDESEDEYNSRVASQIERQFGR